MADLNLTGDWQLANASINSISDRGVPLVASGLALRICEGRTEGFWPSNLAPDNDEGLTRFSYEMNVTLVGAAEPDEITQDEGSIVITGTTTDGRECKIFGRGFAGLDNLKQIEVSFVHPPRIELIGLADPLSDPGGSEDFQRSPLEQ